MKIRWSPEAADDLTNLFHYIWVKIHLPQCVSQIKFAKASLR